MKKIALMSVFALGLGLVACDDYVEPNPKPQTNPQESILQTDEVVTADVLSEDTYDLVELNDNDKVIEVATISCETLPAGYEFGVEAYISNNGFAKQTPVNAKIVAGEDMNTWTIVVPADAMQSAYYSGISKGPKAKEIQIRYQLTTVTGSQVAYIGGPDYYYGPYSLTVRPFPSELIIEEAYYLVGTIDDWSVAQAYKLSHSDLDQYDDPVFTFKFDVTPDQAAAGWWWKIIPQSTYDAGDWVDADYSQYGVEENGDNSPSGMLVPRLNGQDPGAGNFNEAGQWLLTINMEDLTYQFTSAIDVLYTPGDANGWNQLESQQLYTNNYVDYMGYALLSPNGFKFTSAPDWDHTNYGSAGEEGKLDTDGGAGNLSVPEFGLYWCNVNIASLIYSTTLIETIGVVGDATPGGWDNSTALTTTDNLIWTGDITFKGGNFKFRANNGWAVNLGGEYGDLIQDGGDMPSPGEGEYKVTLYLNQLPYSCTLEKK